MFLHYFVTIAFLSLCLTPSLSAQSEPKESSRMLEDFKKFQTSPEFQKQKQ